MSCNDLKLLSTGILFNRTENIRIYKIESSFHDKENQYSLVKVKYNRIYRSKTRVFLFCFCFRIERDGAHKNVPKRICHYHSNRAKH